MVKAAKRPRIPGRRRLMTPHCSRPLAAIPERDGAKDLASATPRPKKAHNQKRRKPRHTASWLWRPARTDHLNVKGCAAERQSSKSCCSCTHSRLLDGSCGTGAIEFSVLQ